MAPAYSDLNDSEQKLVKLVFAQALQAGKTLVALSSLNIACLSFSFRNAASGIKVSLM
jgi:hypothetical protein